MLGAIIGDIAGSRFEWANHKNKDFELMNDACGPTDDSIMTLAVAKALLNCRGDHQKLHDETIGCMREIGRLYPDAGYGGSFGGWLYADAPVPYNSWGNGSAMRVSPCGWAASTLDEALWMARTTAEVTHNHPEGIKGAESVSAAVFLHCPDTASGI